LLAGGRDALALDVSVIIPTFRRPSQLAQAIASVRAQRHVALEIIIVDDCPEGSAEQVVAAAADPRLTYIRNPCPSGGRPGAVRNLAWPLAQGGIVHFLDDDDIVPDGHYAAALAEFARFPDIGILFGRTEPFGEPTQLVQEAAYFARAARRALVCRRCGTRWAYAARMLFGETLLVCGTGLIRRDCIAALGGFDDELRLMEDVEFYTRAIRRCGARFVDRVTLRYRIGPSLMRQGGIETQIAESYRRMHARYRAERGWPEFVLLKAASILLRLAA
jgi:glycosyltransferase involved in cell wall biosynthesis